MPLAAQTLSPGGGATWDHSPIPMTSHSPSTSPALPRASGTSATSHLPTYSPICVSSNMTSSHKASSLERRVQ